MSQVTLRDSAAMPWLHVPRGSKVTVRVPARVVIVPQSTRAPVPPPRKPLGGFTVGQVVERRRGNDKDRYHWIITSIGEPSWNQQVTVRGGGERYGRYDVADHFRATSWLRRKSCACRVCTLYRSLPLHARLANPGIIPADVITAPGEPLGE